jgi:hypothetical protein
MNNNNQDLQFLALILKLDNRVKVYSNPKVKGKFTRINQEYPHKLKDTDFNSQMSVSKINLVDNKIININSKVRYKIKVSLNLR